MAERIEILGNSSLYFLFNFSLLIYIKKQKKYIFQESRSSQNIRLSLILASWSLILLIPWCYQHPKVGKVNPKDARSLDRDSPAPEKIKVTLYPTIIWVNTFTHPDLSCTVQERVYRISFFPPFFLPSFHPSFHPSCNKYF